jgi:ABC-2 type transport system ATP-binding protein
VLYIVALPPKRRADVIEISSKSEKGHPPFMNTVPDQSPAAVSVSGLTKVFGTVAAVDGISFTVPRGSTTALLGGNGAGKTTTISMLLGLIKPTAGRIEALGIDMSGARHKALARMNFESPYVDLPKRLTVRENLRVYGRLYGVRNIRIRIAELAEELALNEFLDRPAGTLSAGQKTRVGLAKAFINRPELLLLDEPTASLDPDTADWVRQHFSNYKKQSGATIVLASHNMTEVERLADNVIMMNKGRIVDEGAPRDLISRYGRENMEEVFIDIARNRRSPSREEEGAAVDELLTINPEENEAEARP